jgi:hypothetical protein
MLVDLSVGIAEGMMKIPFLPDVKIDVLRALADGQITGSDAAHCRVVAQV